ncbi:metalloprotease family protein [Clostridium sp.]|uniref:metalloprotease family protein n=1 Tax=Clostridium sp. TaxID=1506 RepID=UPI002636C234|nr:metalloprotease family protein [Clostridium sp.]
MKLVFQGKYKNESQLPTAKLPHNAQKFKAAKYPIGIATKSLIFLIPLMIMLVGGIYIRDYIHGWSIIYINMEGMALGIIVMFPRLIFQLSMFGKNTEVKWWYSIRYLGIVFACTEPISKEKEILLSLFPHIILGIIPLILWIIMPQFMDDIVLWFALGELATGTADFLNAFYAITQMPKGSFFVLSGPEYYWYIPESVNSEF